MNKRVLSSVTVLLAVAAIGGAPAGATTEPTAAFFEHISLTNKKIELDHNRVDVGTLVIFIVKNNSTHARKITVGSYKSGFLAPNTSTKFELSFPVPWTFIIVSAGRGVPKLTAKFTCSF